MASRCTICASEHVAAIDDLADSNTATLKEIAAQFLVSYPALVRHCARHRSAASAAPENGNSDSLESQASLWRLRADSLWHSATASEDVRGQAQAVAAGLRSVELQARAERRDAEAKPQTEDGSEVVTIAMIDKIIAEALDNPRDHALTKLRRAPDAALELAVRLLDHPQLWGAVETVIEGRV